MSAHARRFAADLTAAAADFRRKQQGAREVVTHTREETLSEEVKLLLLDMADRIRALETRIAYVEQTAIADVRMTA